MTMYNMRVSNPNFLSNMGQTLVYMNCAPNRTVQRRGKRTVSIRTGVSSSNRIALAVTVAMDGTKLPLFCTIKGKKGGKIWRNLDAITLAGIVCAIQDHT